MKSTKDCENFPYTANYIFYFEVKNNGEVIELCHFSNKMLDAYHRAACNESSIYAFFVNYDSELFIIDDLAAFAKAFKIFSLQS